MDPVMDYSASISSILNLSHSHNDWRN